MMLRFGSLTVGSWILLIGFALCGPLQPDDSLKRVAASFDRLERQLQEQPDVTQVLAPGREDLALLIKKYPKAARSWQLSPSLATEMTADEIFRFVTWRANSILACGTVALSLDDLRKSDRGAEPEVPPLSPLFWEGPTTEGPMRISPDCSRLLDESGQPYTVSTRADLQASERLLRRFNPAKSAIRPATVADSERLRRNLDYLRTEHGGQPAPEPHLQGIIGSASVGVYSRQVFVFQAFIKTTGINDVVVLIVPLSL